MDYQENNNQETIIENENHKSNNSISENVTHKKIKDIFGRLS